jgi:hypothetical protein
VDRRMDHNDAGIDLTQPLPRGFTAMRHKVSKSAFVH